MRQRLRMMLAERFRKISGWVLLVLLSAGSSTTPAAAQSSDPTPAAQSTIKVAYFNIKSGKGQIGLPGHTVQFADTTNCTDPTKPLNAWGTGKVQQALTSALSDPSVIVLGLTEAWD